MIFVAAFGGGFNEKVWLNPEPPVVTCSTASKKDVMVFVTGCC